MKVFGRKSMILVSTKIFYLHLLLTHVEALISFDNILHFYDVIYPTYKTICIARGSL